MSSPMATPSNKSSKAKKETAAPAKPAPAKAPAVTKPAASAPSAKAYEPTREEIQTRAFEIYVSEGCKEGTDLENWLRAEKELRARAVR